MCPSTNFAMASAKFPRATGYVTYARSLAFQANT